jgi:tellurite resistance protein TehA-like permease
MKAMYAAFREWVRTLYTGYFACVMATGIVSVALLLSNVVALSRALWVVGFVLLAGMSLIYAVRIIRYRRELTRDLNDPTTAFGFFTFIAGVDVMATRSALSGWTWTPAILTGIAAVAWLGLTYWVFAMLIFTNEKPVERSITGAWLIAIVATESLAITSVLLTSFMPAQRATLQLVSYSFWTFGVLLYLIFIALIMYRFFFFRILPSDLKPPYWINMGAMAITTVAGVRLLDATSPSPFLLSVRPYIQGFTVMMWAWGTWWIPLLLIIGIWKYGIEREPIRYDPALWSIVFPLGMYSTALQLLTHIPGLEFLAITGPASAWLAFAAWTLVALGWIWSTIIGARRALAKGALPSQPAEARAAEATETLERQDAGVGEVG